MAHRCRREWRTLPPSHEALDLIRCCSATPTRDSTPVSPREPTILASSTTTGYSRVLGGSVPARESGRVGAVPAGQGLRRGEWMGPRVARRTGPAGRRLTERISHDPVRRVVGNPRERLVRAPQLPAAPSALCGSGRVRHDVRPGRRRVADRSGATRGPTPAARDRALEQRVLRPPTSIRCVHCVRTTTA